MVGLAGANDLNYPGGGDSVSVAAPGKQQAPPPDPAKRAATAKGGRTHGTLPPPLAIEWSPSWIRAVDTITGRTAEGTNFSELGSLLNGHKQALVGVARNAVFLKTTRLPKAMREDLRRIIAVQLAQLFPLPAQDLSFDFIQTSDITPDGCLTVVGAMRADDLRQLRHELRQAGITPARVLPVALASPALAATAGAKTALVAESLASGLALDVVQDGIVRLSRVAPRGADPVAEAMRTLAAARIEDAPYVVAGDVNLPDSLPAFGSSIGHLSEAPAFDFELAEDRERAEKKSVSDHMTRAMLFLAAALVLVAYVGMNHHDALVQADQAQASFNRQMTKLKAQEEAQTAEASEIIGAQNAVDKAFHPAQPVSDISKVIADSLPPGAWLTGLNIERGKPLEIRGTAKTAADVAIFVSRLGASSRLRSVRLLFANSGTIGQAPVVQFDVSAFAVGNLPMPAPVKSGTAGTTTTTTTTTQSTAASFSNTAGE